MEKSKKNDKRNRIIIVGVIIIVFVILILFLLYYFHKNGILGNSGMDNKVRLKGVSMLSDPLVINPHNLGESCTADAKMCVRDLAIKSEITDQENGLSRGIITYTISSDRDSTYDKPIRVTIGNYKLAFYCGAIAPYGDCTGTFGFENFKFDYSHLDSYSIDYGGVGDDQTFYDNISAAGEYDDLIIDYPPGE